MKVLCINESFKRPLYPDEALPSITPVFMETYTVIETHEERGFLFYEFSEIKTDYIWAADHFVPIQDNEVEVTEDAEFEICNSLINQ